MRRGWRCAPRLGHQDDFLGFTSHDLGFFDFKLRGLSQPEYRLRVDDFRVYYDVAEPEVHILAVITKHLTYEWLETHGIPL